MRDDFRHVYWSGCGDSSRIKESMAPKPRVPWDWDDYPSHTGMADGRRRGWNRRECSGKAWRALTRYLHSQVGRPWSEVWSDICAVVDGRSATGRILRDDILGKVNVSTFRRGAFTGFSDDRDRLGYHVDRDGLLAYSEWRYDRRFPRKLPDAEIDRIEIRPNRELHRIDGCWYEVRYRSLERPACFRVDKPDGTFEVRWTQPSGFDVLLGREVRADHHAGFRVNNRYAVSKRSLSRRELASYHLAGDDGRAAHGPARRAKRAAGIPSWQAERRVFSCGNSI